VKEKPMTIPDTMLSQLLSVEELKAFKASGSVILSITVYGQKPEQIGGGRSCCD
jgi:hypothetical protein